MITERDLGIGVTIDVENVPLSKKYTVAALLAVAICEHSPIPSDLLNYCLSCGLDGLCQGKLSSCLCPHILIFRIWE